MLALHALPPCHATLTRHTHTPHSHAQHTEAIKGMLDLLPEWTSPAAVTTYQSVWRFEA